VPAHGLTSTDTPNALGTTAAMHIERGARVWPADQRLVTLARGL